MYGSWEYTAEGQSRIPSLYDYSLYELKWNLKNDIEELHFITVLHFKFYLITFWLLHNSTK